MSNTIKNFSVGYNPINKSNVFHSGDYIAGQITLEVEKDCKIVSLWVKMKGKAVVKWTEQYGKTTITYYKKEKYFSIKTNIFQDGPGKWAFYFILVVIVFIFMHALIDGQIYKI